MPDWLSVYHRLPYPARVAAASLRGHRLRRWRYGPQSEELVAETLARDTWSAEQWHAWQAERLAYVLHRAATRVPYYREQWDARRRAGDRASWDVLANWPVLRKDDLRTRPEAFLADDCRADAMFYEHTSGTTGKPLHLWIGKDTLQTWFAQFEARARRWYGVSRHDRWGILGGQLVAPVTQQQPPFWVWNIALNQLYLSSYHLAAANVSAYLDALARHGVTYLLGYPSGLYRLAQLAEEQGLAAAPLRVAIGNAEPLYAHQRETISRVFGCPVRETYGMAEMAAAASECDHGRLHLWPDTGLVEILDDDADHAAASGEAGRLIATGLLNADMPLIRYDTGDRAAPATGQSCACGRTLPILRAIEGRSDDVVITADGRHIGRLDPVFKADVPIREAQIIQEEIGRLRVLYVPTDAYSAADGQALIRRIHDRVGEMEVVLEPVTEIPRTANGKFRAVVSRVTARESRVTARESRVTARESRVTARESRVATGESPVATGESRVATGESRVATGESRVATGESRVATGESRVATGESRVAASSDQTGTRHEETAA